MGDETGKKFAHFIMFVDFINYTKFYLFAFLGFGPFQNFYEIRNDSSRRLR